jgi:hypothetical protein
MIDPVTIGALAASLLSIGAEALVKTVVSEPVKDAYKALKPKVAVWATSDVEALEKAPTSNTRQAIIAEMIDQQSSNDKIEIQRLAIVLSEALRKTTTAEPIGIDIGRLEAARVHLTKINVVEGKGVHFDEVATPGDFTAREIHVGKKKG